MPQASLVLVECFMMRIGVIALVSLQVFLISGMTARSASHWRADDMELLLLADNTSKRRFIVSSSSAPGPAKGAIIFEGRRIAQTYTGLYYVYDPRCGRLSFPITGTVAADERSILFEGPSIRLAGALCAPERGPRINYLFQFIRDAEEEPRDVWGDPTEDSLLSNVSRQFLRDDHFSRLAILDVMRDGSVAGEFIDAKSLQMTAQVRGANSAPNVLDLEVKSVGSSEWIGVKWGHFEDSFDAGDGEAFKAHWKTLRPGTGSMYDGPFFDCYDDCNHPVAGWQGFEGGVSPSWTDLSFYRQLEGTLCIAGLPPSDLKSALTKLHIRTGRIEGVSSEACDDNYVMVEVPMGLEEWSFKAARNIPGVTDVKIGTGAPAGSHTARKGFPSGTFVPAKLDPDDLEPTWIDAACKLKSRFFGKFRSISIEKCQFQDDFSLSSEVNFCFNLRLEGHTADKTGFSSDYLPRAVISGKYMITTWVEATVSQVVNRRSPSNFLDKLTVYVVESRFARQPASQTSGSASFKNFESFNEGRSDAELDNYILAAVQRYLGPQEFKCDAGGGGG